MMNASQLFYYFDQIVLPNPKINYYVWICFFRSVWRWHFIIFKKLKQKTAVSSRISSKLIFATAECNTSISLLPLAASARLLLWHGP